MRLRFSLRSLLLLVLAISLGIGCWVRREPWVLAEIRPRPTDYDPFERYKPFAPDGKRYVFSTLSGYGFTVALARAGEVDFNRELANVRSPVRAYGPLFVDDNEFVAGGSKDDRAVQLSFVRRRPEAWWGIAWLPEFWLTIVLAGGFVVSVWRDRRRLAA